MSNIVPRYLVKIDNEKVKINYIINISAGCEN